MEYFDTYVWVWIAIGIITLATLLLTKIRAPYGRHVTDQWGKTISNRWGWIIMEVPALLIMPLLFLLGPAEKDWLSWLLLALWLLHYINRTIIFPFRIKTKGKKMPLTIVFSAIGFNSVNGFFNGYYLGYIKAESAESFFQMHIIFGLLLFFTGMYINRTADNKLIGLRKEQAGYQIPRGWLFKYISCPNHFGEIVEWTGFAILAWNLPALSFAVWSACNLIPRALNHHAWYKENFSEYPKKRKAVFPKIF